MRSRFAQLFLQRFEWWRVAKGFRICTCFSSAHVPLIDFSLWTLLHAVVCPCGAALSHHRCLRASSNDYCQAALRALGRRNPEAAIHWLIPGDLSSSDSQHTRLRRACRERTQQTVTFLESAWPVRLKVQGSQVVNKVSQSCSMPRAESHEAALYRHTLPVHVCTP